MTLEEVTAGLRSLIECAEADPSTLQGFSPLDSYVRAIEEAIARINKVSGRPERKNSGNVEAPDNEFSIDTLSNVSAPNDNRHTMTNSLPGIVKGYVNPTEPVAEDEWEALR